MIYLDHNAATPAAPEVISAIHNYLSDTYGNPSSTHAFGRKVKGAYLAARDRIARYCGVSSEQLIFTSGGTEGANMILRGLVSAFPDGEVISSPLEHASTYDTLQQMQKRSGTRLVLLDPGKWGAVTPELLLERITPRTKLIALTAVNSETGVKTDIEAIAEIAEQHQIYFFVDGVALLGKESFTLPEGVSAAAFSGQKIYATQGVGFCVVRRKLPLVPLITGGAHQLNRRAGTENMPGIIGLAKAVELIDESMPQAAEEMLRLRDLFEASVMENLSDVAINGEGPRVVNTSNLAFLGVEGEMLLAMLDSNGVAASHGSACSSGNLEPSRVLMRMGYPKERVLSSLRFSLGRTTTQEEVKRAAEILIRLVKKLRQSSS